MHSRAFRSRIMVSTARRYSRRVPSVRWWDCFETAPPTRSPLQLAHWQRLAATARITKQRLWQKAASVRSWRC